MAADTSVYEPVMSACEAMIAAMALRMMATGRRAGGSIMKKGLTSRMASSEAFVVLRRIQAPCPR